MNQYTDRLKKAWEENPLQVMLATGLLMQGAAKLMQANTNRRNSKTYNLEVQRRIMMKR